VQLEAPLPSEVAVGAGTALFVLGWCFCPDARIRSLSLVVDGQAQPVLAHGMPRLDVFRSLHPGLDPFATAGMTSDPGSTDDPLLHSYRSGFWGIARVAGPSGDGVCELLLRADLEGGGEAVAELARIPVASAPEAVAIPAPDPAAGPLVAICMATCDPPMELLERQLDSIRGQTHRNWVCVVSDDCSAPESFAAVQEAIGDDPRFLASRSPRRLGFYGNFERALSMAPAGAQYVAMADQDDRWHPEKLEVLRKALGTAQLVYSDQRLVDADGRVLRETLWKGRRNNHTNLASLLVANTITGAATLFRREVAELALPFPETPGFRFHDHWLGLVALASGDVAYVNRPLYDYVQHAGAIFGDVTQGAGPSRRPRREFSVEWRAAYFYGYLARKTLARTLLLRGSARLTARKRRALERFVDADRSPVAFAWLALRPLRSLLGRTETLASEVQLAQGIVWRWVIGIAARRSRAPGRHMLDASCPAPSSFSQKRLRRWRARV